MDRNLALELVRVTEAAALASSRRVGKGDKVAADDAAIGITSGDLLKGVRYFPGGASTHSIVMRSKTRTVRFIEARHHFEHKPGL